MPPTKASLQPHRHPSSTSSSSENTQLTPNARKSPPPTSNSKPISTVARFSYPFFVDHLHNPYPTLQEKEAIVKEANLPEVTLTSVSNWFANSRRRCGWIDICNQYCKGDTKMMVDLCTRVLEQEKSPRSSDSSNVTEKILAMKSKVTTWHKDHTKPSDWAVALYKLLKELTLEETARVEKATNSMAQLNQKDGRPKSPDAAPAKNTRREDTGDNIKPSSNQQRPSQPMMRSPGTSRLGLRLSDECPAPEVSPVAGQKHRLEASSPSGVRYPSTSSLFSTTSESSCGESSVPSLTWSDTEDWRPSKRIRSEETSPTPSTPVLDAPLDRLPFCLDDDFPFAFTSSGDVPAGDFPDFLQPGGSQSLKRRRLSAQREDFGEEDREGSAKRARLTDVPHNSAKDHADTNKLSSPPGVASVVVDEIGTAFPEVLSGYQVTSEPDAFFLDLNPVDTYPPDPTWPLDVSIFDWSTFNTVEPGSDQGLVELLQGLTETSYSGTNALDAWLGDAIPAGDFADGTEHENSFNTSIVLADGTVNPAGLACCITTPSAPDAGSPTCMRSDQSPDAVSDNEVSSQAHPSHFIGTLEWLTSEESTLRLDATLGSKSAEKCVTATDVRDIHDTWCESLEKHDLEADDDAGSSLERWLLFPHAV